MGRTCSICSVAFGATAFAAPHHKGGRYGQRVGPSCTVPCLAFGKMIAFTFEPKNERQCFNFIVIGPHVKTPATSHSAAIPLGASMPTFCSIGLHMQLGGWLPKKRWVSQCSNFKDLTCLKHARYSMFSHAKTCVGCMNWLKNKRV